MAMWAGVQKESRPMERCQAMSQCVPTIADVTATTAHQTYQGTADSCVFVVISRSDLDIIIPCRCRSLDFVNAWVYTSRLDSCRRATYTEEGPEMRNLITGVAIFAIFSMAVNPTAGQTTQAYKIRHTAGGKPDFSGIWQTLGTANWDLEAHAARPAPLLPLGAAGAVPAGLGVVEGGQIPYQPWAAA